ncbi:MAG TPA: SDR family NAD(P)-dependent oxidoreductase [Steroidobacteraceae bacterium]|nr:SDR family NAD(P)-dependent oxidoreductase [Steroidobacteraceae bacterium]
MSAHDEPKSRKMSGAGRERRRFLERTVFAAAGSPAAAWLSPLAAAAADHGTVAPRECPALPTPMREVDGKVAFVTGGDSGIGLGIARAFTEAGMKVVITYRTKAHLDQALEQLAAAAKRVHAIKVDVTDRAGLERAAEETEHTFGKVHVLVANAGVAVIGPLSTATYDDWDWGMGVNATGVFNSIRTFLPRIKKHGEGGQIVATASLAGLLGHSSAAVYTASKFAVVGMMEALRGELMESRIGASVFCPGLVNSNIGSSNRNRPSSLADSGFKPDPKAFARMAKQMRQMRGPPPGMDPLEAGRLVLAAVRNNDLYVLTTPEFAPQFRARGEAIVASLPAHLKVPETRVALEHMIVGRDIYTIERDRRRCERARSRKV